jgi:hypothetical protein
MQRQRFNMPVLFENPLAIAVVGGLFATFALVVFLARRSLASLVALGGIIAVTLLLMLIERLVVSDREQVETGVDSVLAAVEANDLPTVLTWIDPAAVSVRADVQALMPLVKVDKARAMGEIEVTINDAANPPTAMSRFRAFLDGVHGSSGMRVAYFNQQVDVDWVKQGDRWLINGYTAYYDDQPIDAVGSARGNRPVPGR